jgi:hypothetical protein
MTPSRPGGATAKEKAQQGSEIKPSQAQFYIFRAGARPQDSFFRGGRCWIASRIQNALAASWTQKRPCARRPAYHRRWDTLAASKISLAALMTGGSRDELRDQFGNLGLAAAAYNAGPRRVGPPFCVAGLVSQNGNTVSGTRVTTTPAQLQLLADAPVGRAPCRRNPEPSMSGPIAIRSSWRTRLQIIEISAFSSRSKFPASVFSRMVHHLPFGKNPDCDARKRRKPHQR